MVVVSFHITRISAIAPTFTPATQQDVNPPKHINRLRNSRPAATHSPPIASNTTDPILPALPVLPRALALVDELSELCTAVLMLNLERRQTGDDVVAVREQQADQTHRQGRESCGDEPRARRVVRRCGGERRRVSHESVC